MSQKTEDSERSSVLGKEARCAGALLSALAKAHGLQSVVDAGHKALENPVIIFSDKSWKSIAYAPAIDIPDDMFWTEFTRTGTLPLEVVTNNVQNGLAARLDDPKSPVFLREDETKYRRLMTRVHIGGRAVAIVTVIEYSRPFEKEDETILLMLRDAVSAELQKDKFLSYTRGMPHEELIESLLEGSAKNPQRVADSLMSITPRHKEFIYVLAFDIRGFDSKVESVPYVRNYLESLIAGARAVIYNDNIILLADYDRDDEQYDRDMGAVLTFLRKNNMRCGVSRRFTKLSELRTHYFEAMEALAIGVHMGIEKYMYRYDNYAIYHIAKRCLGSADPIGFLHPKLMELMEYDENHNSALTESLYVYLRCLRNITNAAEALHLHRNTLIYHLKRIEEILGIQLSDRDVLLHFEMSFRFLEYDKKIPVRSLGAAPVRQEK
ncbi:MAG: helix-turn-helix domain-containing protein [Oscillospiraceae bacterium]|nr:helix-turn-helix domain-containing protein [Oscillospiraceae bacterium]